jgi:hypothetical protein
MSKLSTTTQKGYAILFAVVVIGIILSISVGLSNSAYKQLILSSVAQDSQIAFYESDTATECALYADIVANVFTLGAPFYSCSVDKNGVARTLNIQGVFSYQYQTYTATPSSAWGTSSDECFEIIVAKNQAVVPSVTDISSKGYSTCNKTSPRAVEREIHATY